MKNLVNAVFINLLLALSLFFLVLAIIKPFQAHISSSIGRNLSNNYRWLEAENEYLRAIKLDPFNSIFRIKLGKFMLLQSGYQGYLDRLFNEARSLFLDAARLDPRNAEPYLRIGLIDISMGATDEAFMHFHQAVQNDPNGFNVSFVVGNIGLQIWDRLDDDQRAFVVERLKIAAQARPSYKDYIYSAVWDRTKDIDILRAITTDNLAGQKYLYDFIVNNSLWEFRKAQADIVAEYMKREAPKEFEAIETQRIKLINSIKKSIDEENVSKIDNKITTDEWFGRTPDGNSVYRNGAMYWSGTIHGLLDLPKGSSRINIKARGDEAGGCKPYMIVKLDGKEVGEYAVASDWKIYVVGVTSNGGIKVLSVNYINDWCDDKEDRNLFVGEAMVKKR